MYGTYGQAATNDIGLYRAGGTPVSTVYYDCTQTDIAFGIIDIGSDELPILQVTQPCTAPNRVADFTGSQNLGLNLATACADELHVSASEWGILQ